MPSNYTCISDNGDDDDDSSAEVLYTLVADCLSSIVFSCHELVQTKPNTTIDGIVKVIAVYCTHTVILLAAGFDKTLRDTR